MFDTGKTGFIETIKISTILNTMGQLFDDNELQALIEENDAGGEWRRWALGGAGSSRSDSDSFRAQVSGK